MHQAAPFFHLEGCLLNSTLPPFLLEYQPRSSHRHGQQGFLKKSRHLKRVGVWRFFQRFVKGKAVWDVQPARGNPLFSAREDQKRKRGRTDEGGAISAVRQDLLGYRAF